MPLTPRDDALLTAKAIAFRTLSSLETTLFVNAEGSEDQAGRDTVLSAIRGLNSFKQLCEPALSTPTFLSSARDHLATTIASACDNGRIVSAEFAESFVSEAEKYISIVADMQRWLHSIGAFATDYFSVQSSVPNFTLQLRIDPDLQVPISGATVPTANGREIYLIINPSSFSIADYFSLPCVLSHEFWCHVVSSFVEGRRVPPGNEWTGCRPNDSWEEGWMDFVQGELLVAELPTFAAQAPAMHSHFLRHSREFLSKRHNPGRSILLSNGVAAADAMLRVLRQYYYKTRSDELFLQLSIGLNALRCSEPCKLAFVHFVRNALIPKKLAGAQSLANLTMSRHDFHEIIKPFIAYQHQSESYLVDTEGLIMAILDPKN
ncbi:MAG TPA: hypothetical protein VIH91_10040 [Terriglobales bacterium]